MIIKQQSLMLMLWSVFPRRLLILVVGMVTVIGVLAGTVLATGWPV